MAFDLSKLSNYVDEQRLPLIKRAVLGAKTTSLINLQTGVKHSAALNIINLDAPLQEGGCGWNAQGDAHLTQRVITAEPLKVNMSFCEKDLLKYWCGYEVLAGLAGDKAPFEEHITEGVIAKVNETLEKLIWQGGADDSDKISGFTMTLEEAGIQSLDTTPTGTPYEAIKKLYKAIPVNVLDKAVIFVGQDVFRAFMLEMVEKNYFHYPADGAKVEEFILPGTNTKVVAVSGLNKIANVPATIVAADPANLFYGTDMMDDAETFDLFYDKSNREWRLAIEFNAGVQIAFPDEVVYTYVKMD